ncbi:MAG: Crp/Fnr family transcriptional regulator, partial [Flavobacteriales bacterium]
EKEKMLTNLLSHLNINEPMLKYELARDSIIEFVPKNSQLMKQGQFVKWFTIIVTGEIRVWHQENDKEITLYKIKDSETCVYSIVAIEQNYQSMVNATALKDTIIVKIPVRLMTAWKKYPLWQEFIIKTLTEKYELLLRCIKFIAFKKIDERIMILLKEISNKSQSKEVNMSHNDIAKEIGTTREVVSKSLKRQEELGEVILKFKKIKIK